MSPASLQGRLLVANPRMADPNFDRTVVLVLAHGDEGALGLVINRPTETAVADALPGWEALASPPAQIFAGGPVEPAAAICLARRTAARPTGEGPPGEHEWWKPVTGSIGTFDLETGPDVARHAVDGLRVFVGYAGWGAGQLEGEVEVGGWFVVAADDGDAFSTAPESLWRSVLRRQRSALALVAAYPPDPSMN